MPVVYLIDVWIKICIKMPFVYLQKFRGFSTISKFVSNFVCSLVIGAYLTQVQELKRLHDEQVQEREVHTKTRSDMMIK
jgi:hypothetical protein